MSFPQTRKEIPQATEPAPWTTWAGGGNHRQIIGLYLKNFPRGGGFMG